jgi:class 3 adenylate cyclase/tetratricopeptide (TPR) repeat protein
MKCPKCQTENPETQKFCGGCGAELEKTCLGCGAKNSPHYKFCGECGHNLSLPFEPAPKEASLDEKIVRIQRYLPEGRTDQILAQSDRLEGERKHVTILFSDLSGYTALSERLDPEEVKEITTRIFSAISQVISEYDGFVEKFVGDAVMALFGVPEAHEDDPIRAIRVAKRIHDLVNKISPELEKRIGKSLSMHTGITTGLVVTGEVNMKNGTHGVAGDPINIASRLSCLAKSGEILVGPYTYRQAEGHFSFESLEPITLKGKTAPVQIYRVLEQKERPITMHRLSGLRADLIGRDAQIAELCEAVENLRSGKGRIISICGDAGTGKSRLVGEFKATLDLEKIQWLEGHAYPYSQSIPYFLLKDLLHSVFKTQESDPPEKLRVRIELMVENLIGKKDGVVPYLGSLFDIRYPEVENIDPESWKKRLQEAARKIFTALVQRAPTIFCLEDLHYADPSFVELLRHVLLNTWKPAIVLCVSRPMFNLFRSQELSGSLGKVYREIRVGDLSPSEAQKMLESLLKTESIPTYLTQLVRDKAEGNPFYLEELVNSLIESGTLVRNNGNWKVSRPIKESEISSTINGVISARLDRLDDKEKRILQEASVIGRAFLYEILKSITELRRGIDECLNSLERLDMIRTKSFQPYLEFIFKHALIQEVTYNGLLRTHRKEIHLRIAMVMEQLFHERLSEFYETLAFHFKQGGSFHKALDYLMKSGEKSRSRYSLGESHKYFKEAFEILSEKSLEIKDDQILCVDLLLKWAPVFNYRGAYSELIDLFRAHEQMACSIDDKERLGMFYTWLGLALWGGGSYRDSYQILIKSLDLGEQVQSSKVIGYSCAWLSRACVDLGLLEDAVAFGSRAQEISLALKSDRELFRYSAFGLGYAYFFIGKSDKTDELGKLLLDYGQKQADIRMTAMGHVIIGMGRSAAGDLLAAIESFKRAVQISIDPLLTYISKLLMGYSYVGSEQLKKAEETLEDVMRFSEASGFEFVRTAARGLQGIVLIAKGNLSQGICIAEEVTKAFLEKGNRYRYALFNYLIGKVYNRIYQRKGPKNLFSMLSNLGFLVKSISIASKKAEEYLNEAITMANEIDAKGLLGQACLELGTLYKAKGKTVQAKKYISEAINIFQQCQAEIYLKQAKEALASTN